jgi:metal-dependent amidase/aminoacylase/carboxypeptidase family protein
MLGLRKAAEAHLAIFQKALAEAGTTITIRQPAPKPASGGTDVTKILGARPSPSSAVGTTTTVGALVSGPANVAGTPLASATPAQVDPLGRVADCDIVLRVLLSDVLLDPTKKHGKTLFDTAKDVLIDGGYFRVEKTERGGLAPLGPYILWVGLVPQRQ